VSNGNPEDLVLHNSKLNYDHILRNIIPLLWRRRRVIYTSMLMASFAAFLFYGAVGERYEAFTLLRIGQGIKDRLAGTQSGPFGEGIDLVSRMDSLARLGATNHVIREAASKVGFDSLFHGHESTLFSKLRHTLADLAFFHTFLGRSETKVSESIAIATLRDRISAKQEGRSELFRITFRHPDPSIAAEFLNELANSFIAIQAELVQVPGAETFFQQQAKRLEQEAEKAAAELQNFSVTASVYSVTDQRALLLRRSTDLVSAMSTTRGSIEDRKGQQQALVDQLRVLKPVAQSKTVSRIVDSLGGHENRTNDKAPKNLLGFEESPPLLLVRVYQDAMASLLKVNTELNGLHNLEKLLSTQIEQVNMELAALSSKEAEYDRLKRALSRASAGAEHYGTRMIEEQISSEVAKKTQLGNVRVVQLAETPTAALFPKIPQLAMMALVGGLALGVAIILLGEIAATRLQRQDQGEDEFGNAVDERDTPSLQRYRAKVQAAE
jgi:succinoglycan biosynthesis transport protein ExoP